LTFSFPSLELKCQLQLPNLILIPGFNGIAYIADPSHSNSDACTLEVFNYTSCTRSTPIPDISDYFLDMAIVSPLDPTIIYGHYEANKNLNFILVKLQYSSSKITILKAIPVGYILPPLIFTNNNLMVFSCTYDGTLTVSIFDSNLNKIAVYIAPDITNFSDLHISITYTSTNLFIGIPDALYQYDIAGDFSTPQSIVYTEPNAFNKWGILQATSQKVSFVANLTTFTVFDYDPNPFTPTAASSTASASGTAAASSTTGTSCSSCTRSTATNATSIIDKDSKKKISGKLKRKRTKKLSQKKGNYFYNS